MAVEMETIVDVDELMIMSGEKHSIYRIPFHMKETSPNVYTPRYVSIGPYHYGDPRLSALQPFKARSLKQWLVRTNQSLENYVDALKPFTEKLLDSYQLLDKRWSADPLTFLKLMVLDGAFLCEFSRGFSEDYYWKYDIHDPIFSLGLFPNLSRHIIPDILMLENQIPLIVIERLIAVQTGELDNEHYQKAHKLVLNLVGTMPFPLIFDPGLHFLDVYKKLKAIEFNLEYGERCLYSHMIIKKFKANEFTPVKSVSELLDAGVQFRVSKCTSMGTSCGIRFKDGTLSLPFIAFGSTDPLYLNVIAFEHLHYTASKEVSCYLAFMHGLISSPKDVAILTSLGVIRSHLKRNEDVFNMINKSYRHVSFHPYSELCEVRDSVNEYHSNKMKNKMHLMKLMTRLLLLQWLKSLLQTYLKNPWTILSLLAATILLLLTLFQTIYTMKSYYEGA